MYRPPGKKTSSCTRCLKSKNCEIILENGKILHTWVEYISELFEDHRKDCNGMKGTFIGPPIMKNKKDEIKQSNRP